MHWVGRVAGEGDAPEALALQGLGQDAAVEHWSGRRGVEGVDGVGVEVEDAVGTNALDIGFSRADPGCSTTLAYFKQGTPLLVEQVDADATRAEAIAGQVPRLGRDEGRRGGEQALEQVLDAAVEDKGAVVRWEIPSVSAPDVVPTASGGVDLNLIDC